MKTLHGMTHKAGEMLREGVEQMENRFLAAEGRKAIKAKVHTTAKVTKKALKAGAMVGALTTVTVVAREVRKRQKLNA
jgi:hypothetical protein